jgi:cytochrome b561
MTWKSGGHRYGAVAMAMHWATAAAIFGLLGSGLMLERADQFAKAQLLRVHATVGILVFVLTLLRLGWWAFADRKPEEPVGQPRWQAFAARLVHRLFYAVTLVMGASGIAMLALSGATSMLFLGEAGVLPDFDLYPPRAPHGLGAWLMMTLIAVHIGAALYHQFVKCDGLLGRMGIGGLPS